MSFLLYLLCEDRFSMLAHMLCEGRDSLSVLFSNLSQAARAVLSTQQVFSKCLLNE